MIGRETRLGGFAPAFVVDPEFADEVSKYSWVSVSCGRYLAACIGGKMVMLHRYIYFLANGHCPKIVDHINRNRFDCRLANLREADISISNRNRSHRRGKHPPGVGHQPLCRQKPYQARIVHKKKTTSLGYFSTPEEASFAVANARLVVL